MSNIKLFNEDCMEGMRRYPDKYFELAIVDPPYGINAATSMFTREGKQTGKSKCISGIGYKKGKWDSKIPNYEYFTELLRVSKNQIIWGGNYFISELYSTSCFIVWDKVNGNNLYADCELAWTSFNSAVRKIKFKWHGMLQEHMKNKEIRIHPTQKPVKLYEWLLKNYAKPGDKIFDTHGGSMSIALACHNMNHDLVLFELDKDYFEAGKKRLIEYQKQEILFL